MNTTNEEQISHAGDHINEFFMAPQVEEYQSFLNLDGPMPPDHLVQPSRPPYAPCQKSLFTEDFTPPELANTLPPPSRDILISPNTLHATLTQAIHDNTIASEPNQQSSKKRRQRDKRKNKGAASQPAPTEK